MKKKEFIRVKKTEKGVVMEFDPMFAVKTNRVLIPMNTGTRVEQPKKGKGSYRRHPKHKKELFYDYDY